MSEPITMVLIGVVIGAFGVLYVRWGKTSLARMAEKYPNASSSYRYRRFNIRLTQVVSIVLSIWFLVAGIVALTTGKH